MPRAYSPRYSFKGLTYQMQTFHICHLQFMVSWLEDKKELLGDKFSELSLI